MADSIEKESDIMDYYVSGESFPMGRMAFMYETIYTEEKSVKTLGINDNIFIIFIIVMLAAVLLVGGSTSVWLWRKESKSKNSLAE